MNCVDEVKIQLKCMDKIKKMVDHYPKVEIRQIK